MARVPFDASFKHILYGVQTGELIRDKARGRSAPSAKRARLCAVCLAKCLAAGADYHLVLADNPAHPQRVDAYLVF